ncbi:MAG: hypothetical protein BJ554DRAFT_6869 [Olpidium bornovanus]|uniref:DNA mismatch repair protein MutS connector domain-containing protein n=1 Tax=Olpidium bornovanus TaxID=278681 RepID=A0A8H7ZX66_9FUNG|nr:MAG: hypothetical protein BJ554DRAFT_6869 [Olpidium bornovanus]
MPTRASSPTESRSGRLRATDDERAHGAAIAERDRSAAHCSSAALDAGPPCRPLWDLTPPGGASSRVVPPTPSTVRTAFASELIPPPPPLSSLRSRDALSPRPATRSATPSSSRSRTPRPSTGGGRRSGSRLRTANAGGGSGDGGVVVAVVEGRGVTGWVGLAALNLTTSECIVSQFADTQTYVKTLHKLSIYAPAEIVVSSTIVDPVKSKLYELLEEALPDGVVVPVARKYFSDNAGLGYLKQYSLESELAGLMVGITSK